METKLMNIVDFTFFIKLNNNMFLEIKEYVIRGAFGAPYLFPI